MRKASKRSVPLISFVEVNTNSERNKHQLSASFKDMAASGGYWLACAGKEIYVRWYPKCALFYQVSCPQFGQDNIQIAFILILLVSVDAQWLVAWV